VTLPIPIRLGTTDAYKVVTWAATDAEILIAPGPPGYREIRFAVAVSPPSNYGFFALEADLIGAVRLADGVEPGAPE
jgi:hypothetical protein